MATPVVAVAQQQSSCHDTHSFSREACWDASRRQQPLQAPNVPVSGPRHHHGVPSEPGQK